MTKCVRTCRLGKRTYSTVPHVDDILRSGKSNLETTVKLPSVSLWFVTLLGSLTLK